MSDQRNYWISLAATRCPRAAAAGFVSGVGPYALLSCRNADGLRHVMLFENEYDRMRALQKMDFPGRCAESSCKGDHPTLKLTFENEPQQTVSVARTTSGR